jgi:hypothetical protein
MYPFNPYLRQQTIFGAPAPAEPFVGPPAPPTGLPMPPMVEPPIQPGIPITDSDIIAGLRAYQPETAMQQRTQEMLKQFPRQRNKPGFWRKLGASTVALGPGGLPAAERALYAPHMQRLEDWEAEFKPTLQAAQIERYGNVNERALQSSIAQAQLKEREIERKEKADEARVALQQEKNRILDMKSRGWKFNTSGDWVIALDPNDPTKSYNTGIRTKDLTTSEQIDLKGEWQVTAAEAAQPGKERLAEIREREVFNIPDPNDPTGQKQIAIERKPDGTYQPITVKGKEVPVQRPTGRPGATKQPANLDVIRGKAQDALAALDLLLEVKDESKPGTLRPGIKTGLSRVAPTQWIPGTEAYAGDAKINRLKALLIVELIGEMKAQSRTGATGFGQLNLRELAVLENAASMLDPALDKAEFERELNRIRERLKKIIAPIDGFEKVTTPTAPSAPKGWKYIPKPGGGWTAVEDKG